MDAERSLVMKAVQSSKIEELMAQGIEPAHFAKGSREQQVWMDLTDFVRRYRVSPSKDRIKSMFPDIVWEEVVDPLQVVVDDFKTHVKFREGQKRVKELALALDQGHADRIDELFTEAARDLQQVVPSRTVSKYAAGMSKRIEQYELDEIRGTNWGIKMGIPVFDESTYGIQKHEMVSIVGWQNTGKSTLMQWLFFNAYMQGKTPMIISLEMGEREIQRKFDAFALGLSYKVFRSCKLSPKQRRVWRDIAARAEKAKNDIYVIDDVGRSCTVDTVYGLIDRYRPDICAIDYVSLMNVPQKHAANWEKVTFITNNLKQIVKATETPIVAIAQTNIDSASEGAKLENIAFARSIGADSDIVMGLHQTDDMRSKCQMEVRLLKNRQGAKQNADLYWDMDQTEIRPWTPEDTVNSLQIAEDQKAA
jgi:replicative DNA helicase